MGAFLFVLAWSLGVTRILGSEHPPISYVPRELIHLFHPDELDDYEHAGAVERHRRASGRELVEDEFTYTLYSLGGAPCILAQTECTFYLDYRTLRYGVQTVEIKLPKEPEVSGSCVRDGDTAVLTMRWSVFNFSLIFTENPEGNSYYLNTAVLKFNQSLDIFQDATYRGPVILQTQEGWNYYFTPLGKSYACEHGEDQGPLSLYNTDDEKVGNMTLWNTRFQPFVKRAKGDWGPENHCLPKSIQVMREDVVPFVVSGIFLASLIIVIVGYGLFRKFNVKKAEYGFYGEDGPPESGGGGTLDDVERFEMQETDPTLHEQQQPQQPQQALVNGNQIPVEEVGPKEQPRKESVPAANPFKKNKASNPFNQ